MCERGEKRVYTVVFQSVSLTFFRFSQPFLCVINNRPHEITADRFAQERERKKERKQGKKTTLFVISVVFLLCSFGMEFPISTVSLKHSVHFNSVSSCEGKVLKMRRKTEIVTCGGLISLSLSLFFSPFSFLSLLLPSYPFATHMRMTQRSNVSVGQAEIK